MRLSRALLLPGVDQPLEMIERELPDPSPGDALVRIEACGVCGSDLFLQRGGFGTDRLPVVPGHEAAGRVEAVGSPSDAWLVGRQVALYYIHAPGDSIWALSGHINVGPQVQRMGVDVDGAFADAVIRPVSTLIPVDPEMDPATVAVATDALATPFHALTAIANLEAGQTLAVVGVGGIGSNAVQIGRMLGANVVAVGRSAAKMEQARTLGAAAVLASSDGVDAVREAAGANIDVVVECTGSEEMAGFAVGIAGFRSRVVLVGASRKPIPVASADLIWREISLVGSRGFTPDEIVQVLEHVRAGRLATDHLTQTRRPMSQANDALEDLRTGRTMRTVLVADPAMSV